MQTSQPAQNNYPIVLIAFALGFYLLGTPIARSQTPPADPPKTNWQSSAGVGLSLTRGNSENLLFNARIDTFRQWERDDLRLSADTTYGTTETETTDAAGVKKDETSTTASQARGTAQYNHLFSERFYGGLRLEVLHDDIADVSYRITVSPLAGYYFVKKEKTKLSGELGPGFIFERQGGEDDNYTALRIGERFDHTFSARAKMWQTAEFLPKVDDFSTYLFNFEIGAEASLTEKLSLRLVFRDNYNSEPASGRKENDMQIISGIVYRF
jgi:putative salt-induced outer membrane protein YdiY